jgi:hypothetical protein
VQLDVLAGLPGQHQELVDELVFAGALSQSALDMRLDIRPKKNRSFGTGSRVRTQTHTQAQAQTQRPKFK